MPLNDLPEQIKLHIVKSVNGDDYHNKPNTFSLTELLYCVRKSFYRRKIPRDLDLESSFNIYRGKVFDNLWCGLFQHNQVRSTYRCRHIPITISGKYDFITSNNVLTDLKTTKSLYYIKEPSEEYKKQVRFYAWLNSLDKAQIIYIDFGDCKVFPVEVGDCTELFEELEDKAAQLYFALENCVPPVKGADGWMCKKCEYAENCKEDEDGV